MELKELQRQLYGLLEQGEKQNRLINVGELRGCGKTFILGKFAKDNGYKVLERRYNSYDTLQGKRDLYVIDENIDYNKLPKWLQEKVVTGFCNPKVKNNENDIDLSFTEEVVKNLKLEAEELSKSLKKCREQENFSMYKNLINAYRDVVRLIQEYDYKLMYSEYHIGDENGNSKQVAIWEQNDDGVVRNHKVWDVKDNIEGNKETIYEIKFPNKIDKEFINDYISKLQNTLPNSVRCIGRNI